VLEYHLQSWREWEGAEAEVQPGWREGTAHEDEAVFYRQFRVQIVVVGIAG
jgi:hypothetical protein